MKHMMVVQIPAKEESRIDKITCDLCGAVMLKRYCRVDEVTIKHTIGENFPEGGSGIEASCDMCGNCFQEKLIPWLNSQGVKIQVAPWDW